MVCSRSGRNEGWLELLGHSSPGFGRVNAATQGHSRHGSDKHKAKAPKTEGPAGAEHAQEYAPARCVFQLFFTDSCYFSLGVPGLLGLRCKNTTALKKEIMESNNQQTSASPGLVIARAATRVRGALREAHNSLQAASEAPRSAISWNTSELVLALAVAMSASLTISFLHGARTRTEAPITGRLASELANEQPATPILDLYSNLQVLKDVVTNLDGLEQACGQQNGTTVLHEAPESLGGSDE